jgi:Xaa-Pro aminopeptidase
LPKACKNETEQAGMRTVHLRDAVAVCRFLYWLSRQAQTGVETEISAAEALLIFRRSCQDFRGESFPAISGAGEHGAIIHYRVTDESDRPIKPNEVYLIDSGAQFPEGTTDITRTIWTGPGAAPAEVKDRVTRVLQGHIAIATAIFPQGVAGAHIDALARRALWQVGLDYDHGTGHGVGSYLSVHEGPVSISRAARPVPIMPGMVLSNEPGFYLPNHYGIRLENLLLVQTADMPGARKPFLRFETLTLAPFDRHLLDPELLTSQERAWLDDYHARVLETLSPHLPPLERAWLAEACAPL